MKLEARLMIWLLAKCRFIVLIDSIEKIIDKELVLWILIL